MDNSDSIVSPHNENDDTVFIAPKAADKHDQFVSILKTVLPYIGADECKIILAEVMIALKVEGIIGAEMNAKAEKMVNVISDSILKQPGKKKAALKFADRLLN